MQAYRQSVYHLRPEDASDDDSKDDYGSNDSIVKRLMSYRQSWHPNWMDSNAWIEHMELPEDLTLDIADDEDEKYGVDARASRMIDPAVLEAQKMTMQAWEQSELRDKWYPLLCNVARAVTQATPWGDPTITKDIRQGILLAVLQRFLDHSADRRIMALQTKELLNTIKEEDPTLEIQLSLVAFTNGQAWEGGVDRYRSPSNWRSQEDLRQFRTETDTLVQQRLHQINDDVSKTEARLTDAIDQWTQVHSTSACYGGGAHDVVPFDERNTNSRILSSGRRGSDLTSGPSSKQNSVSMNSAREEDSYYGGNKNGRRNGGGPSPPTAAAPASSFSRRADNQIHLNLQSIFIAGTNPSTGKRINLPSNAVIHVAYYHGGNLVEEIQLKGRARAVADEKLHWNGADASFNIPRANPQGDPDSFANIDRSELVITIEEGRMCGIFGGKHIAQIAIPVSCMYDGINPLHCPDRAKVVEQRKQKGDPREVGIHFCCTNFVDGDSGVAVRAAVSMDCRTEIHNRCPPRVDVLREMARLKRRVSETRDNVWALDHHAQFIELADILGELKDAEHWALRLYADRFFVHEELSKVQCLVAFATKGNFTDWETREGMADACEILIAERDTLKTVHCKKICEAGLLLAQRQCIERVLAIEDVSQDPSNGQSIMDTCLRILELMDVNEDIVKALVEVHANEFGDYVARKLRKLLIYIPTGGKADGRFSILLEVEQKEDSHTLLAKTRAFYEIVDTAIFLLTKMIQFAVDTQDDRVKNLAFRRANLILDKMFDPLSRALTAFFGELAKANNADPLGDAFGVITTVYERIMEFTSVIDDIPELEANCIRMVEPFNNYLPSWFTMCMLKVPGWIKKLVKVEPLEPIAKGRIYCSNSPSDGKNLLDAIFAVFDKVIDWVDPETSYMYVTNFAKLVLSFVECFTDALVDKATASLEPLEWMVAICTLTKFESTVQLFWQEKVFNGVVRTFGSEDGLLMYQCQSLKASSMEHLMLRKDDLSSFIGISMRGAAMQFLEEAAEEANHPNITKDEYNQIFGSLVTDLVRAELSLIAENTDKVSAPIVLIQAAKGLHGSFTDFAIAQCSTVTPIDFKYRMMEALAAIEVSLEEFNDYDRIPPEVLFDLSHKSRQLVHLVSQPTADLIDSLDGKKGSELTAQERERLFGILRQRPNDKVATKYLKNAGMAIGGGGNGKKKK